MSALNILLVSHEASATGAPIFLLNFAKWLQLNVRNVYIHTIILKDDSLLSEWQKVGDVSFMQGFNANQLTNKLKDICSAINNNFDIIYFNTIETSHVLSCFVDNNWFGMDSSSILHIHELEGTIQKYGVEKVRKINQYADYIVAVSQVVRNNLVFHHGFKAEKIKVIYPCSIDLLKPVTESLHQDSIKNKIPTVLGCGEIAVVKGPDLFIQSCYRVVNKLNNKDCQFNWVGENSHGILPYLQNDLVKLNLSDHLSFVGFFKDVSPWFSSADVFFLSSREDSCPLVCLEAASIGLPIVYFKGSGGMDEVLGDEAGFPVPYMDVDAAAQAIDFLLKNKEKRDFLGKNAREVYLKYHNAEIVYNHLFSDICKLMERCLAVN